MPALTVDLNTEGLHDLSVPSGFLAHGRFRVLLRNHGEPVHVHLGLDETLSRVAAVEEANHFVDRESEVTVDVTVRPIETAVSGVLTVATAHGSKKKFVNVTIEPKKARTQASGVIVDEQLATPPARSGPAEPSLAERIENAVSRQFAGISSALIAFAIASILLVLVLSFYIGGTWVFLGALLVSIGAIVAVLAAGGWH